MSESYNALLERARRLAVLGSITSLVHWDFETYMPPDSVTQRGLQLQLLRQISHHWQTDPAVGQLLADVESSAWFKQGRTAETLRNVALIRRAYDRNTKLPERLVKAIARQAPASTAAWKRAKQAQDFSLFQPALEKTTALAREKAACLAPDGDLYDALLDLYEPGMTGAVVSRLFDELKAGLVPLVKRYASESVPGQAGDEFQFIARAVPVPVQRRITAALCDFIGYDARRTGRVDETEHPFTSGQYDDVRICTHYHEHKFLTSFYSVLHEGGHGLYEQDIPRAWHWQLVGSAASFGIHESQSRFMENVVGRSPAFWEYFLPRIQEITGEILADLTLARVTRAVNRVVPSPIRIEADEVTYSLHVILRFEIERALIAGDLEVADLPRVWNEKMAEYLGVEVAHPAEGVLQDTHWSQGAFGYFPSYALGNLYDGMFLARLDADAPAWREVLAGGDFTPVRGWLVENVHRRGALLDPADLVESITGQPVSARRSCSTWRINSRAWLPSELPFGCPLTACLN